MKTLRMRDPENNEQAGVLLDVIVISDKGGES